MLRYQHLNGSGNPVAYEAADFLVCRSDLLHIAIDTILARGNRSQGQGQLAHGGSYVNDFRLLRRDFQSDGLANLRFARVRVDNLFNGQ